MFKLRFPSVATPSFNVIAPLTSLTIILSTFTVAIFVLNLISMFFGISKAPVVTLFSLLIVVPAFEVVGVVAVAVVAVVVVEVVGAVVEDVFAGDVDEVEVVGVEEVEFEAVGVFVEVVAEYILDLFFCSSGQRPRLRCLCAVQQTPDGLGVELPHGGVDCT